jgi:sugar phosphate isomerase/epimerase
MTKRRRAIRKILELAEDCRAKRVVMSIHEGDDGSMHARGGYWISTPSRAIYGYTLENAKAVKRILEELGEGPCSIDRAEGELAAAIANPERFARDRSAERMKRRRDANVAAGLCHCGADRREGLKTCAACSRAAQVRTERSRYLRAAARDDEKGAA